MITILLVRANARRLQLSILVSLVLITSAGCGNKERQSAKQDQKSSQPANAPVLPADSERAEASTDNQPDSASAASPEDMPLPIAGSTPTPPSNATARSLSDIIDSVDDGVVLLTTQDALKRDNASGSAFAIDRSGLVVTNFHVLREAISAFVQFRDGRKHEVLGVRAVSLDRDLAIIQLRDFPENLETFELIRAAELRQGEELIAIGHPSGFKFTVTTGIVSAVRKTKELPEEYQLAMSAAEDTVWVQTSAAISSGSSGGPLLDRAGNLVGVNTWVAQGQNLGFAVDVRHVLELKSQIQDQVQPLPLPGLGLITEPRVAAIAEQAATEYMVFARQVENAGTIERVLSIASRNPVPGHAARLLELAESDPKQPIAFQALLCLSQLATEAGVVPSLGKAVRLFESNYLDHPRMNEVAMALASVPRKDVVQLLYRLMTDSPHEHVRAVSCYALAMGLSSSEIRQLQYRPEIAEYLGRFIEHSSSIPLTALPVQMEVARQQLFAMKHLARGAVAPNIVGKDLNGADFELADYRGRVTVVDFWADWCPYCRDMYPHQRNMVQRLETQPFALLGVNADERPTVEQLIAGNVVTWRNWHDGPQGDIAKQWQISSFPTTYVLDRSGTILSKGEHGDALEAVVERLLGEMQFPLPYDVLPLGSTWRYYDKSLDGVDWRAPDYDDSDWPAGKAPLGFGVGNEATLLPRRDAPTIYFRTAFDVNDVEHIRDLIMGSYFDDCVAVYINGTEVMRTGLAAQAGYEDRAGIPCFDQGRDADYEGIDPKLIRPGKNVIAAELHQESMLMTDLRFDLGLSSNSMTRLREELTTPNSVTRRWAIVLIRALGSAASELVPDLQKLLKEGDLDMQVSAATALLRIDPAQISEIKLLPAQAAREQDRTKLGLSLATYSWFISKERGCSPKDYEVALQYATLARMLLPSSAQLAQITGMAQFRLGQYATARDTLNKSMIMRVDHRPGEIAGLCMAQHKSGKNDDALKTLQRLRQFMQLPNWSRSLEGHELLEEAETLLAGENAQH